MQEKLAILLSRKLSGEASTDELLELEQWIKANPQDHYMIDIVQSYWHHHPVKDWSGIADNAHFERILRKAATSGSTEAHPSVPIIKRRRQWMAAAAVFLGCILLGAVWMYQQDRFSMRGPEHEVATAPGARSHVILPDGTKVWINAASRLHYDKKFNGALREVYLDGEAFFDVKKDKTRPFIVHTSDIDIRVLGTAFNVKSYKEEPTIEATLIHGSIQVTSKSKQSMPKILMAPHEKLVFTKTVSSQPETVSVDLHGKGKNDPAYFLSKVLPADKDSSYVETSWVHNRLLFEGDTFKELAAKMERWFDVEIKFSSTDVANYRLRGVFEDESVEEALKALQQIANFKYAIKDKSITIAK